jgi:hypothetical protein
MKKTLSQALLSCSCFFVCVLLSACNKSHELSTTTPSSTNTKNLSINSEGQSSISSYPCVDIWDYVPGGFNWAVTYPCPQNAIEDNVNKQDIKRQKRIDSIFRATNMFLNKEAVFNREATSPCNNPIPSHLGDLVLYGTSAVVNDINVFLADYSSVGQTTLTVYVLQNGILGGGVFISLQQGSLAKTFGFYPQSSYYTFWNPGCGFKARGTGGTVPGGIRNNNNLPYSVSISKVLNAAQFQNLAMYLSNVPNSSFYNYDIATFNEVHYALGALSTVGINSLSQISIGSNNYENVDTPYLLGQKIKTLTNIPLNTTIDLLGGFTPGIPEETE